MLLSPSAILLSPRVHDSGLVCHAKYYWFERKIYFRHLLRLSGNVETVSSNSVRQFLREAGNNEDQATLLDLVMEKNFY